MKAIYLDYAAATPMDTKVFAVMKPYFTNGFYNPSATYTVSRKIKHDLEGARGVIGNWLGAKPGEIYFTAGATEANNLAIKGVMEQFPDGELLVSSIEHDSILEPAKLYKHKLIPVSNQGLVDVHKLQKLITKNTVLISVMMVNNELGTVQPLKDIANLIKKARQERLSAGNIKPLYLHTDAAQAGNYLDLHTARLGVDLMSINGGKIYGPKQSGSLYVRAGIVLKPIILGGGQEHGLRSGTENVAGSIGLAKALDTSQNKKNKESERVKKLKELFIDMLTKNIADIKVNGSNKHQSPHIVHVSFAGKDNERLMMELDERGIQVAVGSACSAANMEPSHVLRAIGMSDDEARSSLRFSFGRQTNKNDIQKTIKILKSILHN
jgi:cysteine desulfurase